MTVNKNKKVRKQRGYSSHGYGARKKHRGAGSRGGRGMAGSGRRADQKKPTILNIYGPDYFKKTGFKSKVVRHIKPINIEALEQMFDELLASKKIKEEKGFYVINLEDIGFNKLLGKGKASKKFMIHATAASAKAAEKIRALGGDVITKKEEK